MAGLIKAAMVAHERVLPPSTACAQPHGQFAEPDSSLQVLQSARPWPQDEALRAGVSAMGFGGINTHVVLQADPGTPRRQRPLPATQDCEIFFFDAPDAETLRQQLLRLRRIAVDLSRAELSDVSAALANQLSGRPVRAAVIAADPATLAQRLDTLLECLDGPAATKIDPSHGVFLGMQHAESCIGLLCTGQGYPITLDGGAIGRRFSAAAELYDPPISGDIHSPQVVQPAVIRASLAAIRVLESLGISADLAIGHSLGELTALAWAGAFDEATVLELASTRGRLMAELSAGAGAMASIGADPAQVRALCDPDAVAIACHNGPRQTVISGPAADVRAVIARAQDRHLPAVILKTTHAFHSSMVAAAGAVLPKAVVELGVKPIRRMVVSTVTGEMLTDSQPIPELLGRQITSPVLFVEAIAKVPSSVGLFIEVGSGDVLSRMVSEFTDIPAIPVDVGGESLRGLLGAVGATFALGADVKPSALFENRVIRPFSLDWKPRFFANPCESAPIVENHSVEARSAAPAAVPETDFMPAGATPLEVLRQVIATQEELLPQSIQPQSHLLRDLHLNSLKVAEIVAKTCRQLGLPPPASPTEMSGATVGQIAQALENQQRTGSALPGSGAPGEESPFPPGVDSWVRTFKIEWIQRPLAPAAIQRPVESTPNGDWQIFHEARHPLAASLKSELSAAMPQGGVALLLHADPDSTCVGAMLASARAALARFSPGSAGIFIVVHRGVGAALAKTLWLECPGIAACVVDVPLDHPSAAKWVTAEALVARGYCESRYDSSGQRWIPTVVAGPRGQVAEKSAVGLGPQDVLLVSGGGKGIAAECALELACWTGTRLLILGRSRPEHDAELAANLSRLTKRGVIFSYHAADVTDSAAVAQALRQGQKQTGAVSAILHGAGTNNPQLLGQLDEESFLHTLRPKREGLLNLLASVDADRLKLMVTFGSVIARIGMRGEADYAVANEWMGRIVEQFQQRHPNFRCLNLEWSVWSGVGMGPRLGSITPLIAQGISPISPDAGVRKLLELLADPSAAGSMIVSGRYGDLSTLQSEGKFQPGRFVRTARCFYPGVELVADTEFSMSTDPYLADHVFRGRCLLPGVVGLEMMAEAAANVLGTDRIGAMEEIRFDHPIEIPRQGRIELRVAALSRQGGGIDVVVRSSATRFAVNHFTAVCRSRAGSAASPAEAIFEPPNADSVAAHLDPKKDLYGRILFQGKAFQRIKRYEVLRARQCIAQITEGDAEDGLGDRHGLVLGDPAGRDAAIHAIQACIPHITVLPVSIQRLEVFRRAGAISRVVAQERGSDPGGFIYDLKILSEDGQVIERWSGLRLQIVSECRIDGPWPAGLLPPYLERRIGDLIPASQMDIEWEANGHADREPRPGRDAGHRPDGKPDVVAAARRVSRAYFQSSLLTCTSGSPVAVDAEAINGKSADQWALALGSQRMALARTISESSREPLARAASRVWCAVECLSKLSAAPDAPLILATTAADGWTLLRSGQITVASYVAPVGEMGDVCLAFAAGQPLPRAYEFTVRVGFDEVNRMGTVNFQSYFNWQARCREAFLHDHVPTVLRDLHQGSLLVTTDASCEYLAEIVPERDVLLRMTLGELGEHRLMMRFEYVQNVNGTEVIVARGRQTTASMSRGASGLVAAPVPAALRAKLAEFT
ncbi:MAG: SDR family NAD(P)-dependent oxidoreductase [Tepidisphaeraceae bacterium]